MEIWAESIGEQLTEVLHFLGMPSRLKQSLRHLLGALRTPLVPETPSTPPPQVPEVLEGNSGLEVTWSMSGFLPAPTVSSDVDRASGTAQVQNAWWWRG